MTNNDSARFLEILYDSFEIYKILQEPKSFCKELQDATRFYKILARFCKILSRFCNVEMKDF